MKPFSIEFSGNVPSKKNQYKKRSGPGRGMFKDAKMVGKLNALARQIPPEYRDLNLEHPDIVFEFFVCALDSKGKINGNKIRCDRDNKMVTLGDLLVEYGVLAQDDIAHCNGTITILPARLVDTCDKTIVTITPKEAHESSSKVVAIDRPLAA